MSNAIKENQSFSPDPQRMPRLPDDSRDMRKFGYQALLKIAIPLAATVGCFAITLFTDRTLLMWYEPTSSAASISAGNLYWALVCIPVTALGFATPLVASASKSRSSSEGALRACSIVWQSVWITLGCLPAFAMLGWASDSIFVWFDHPVDLATREGIYFRTLLFVAPASMLEAGLTAYFIGKRVTRPILVANVFSSLCNVVLDFWFIFGGLGVPAMGVLGAALATGVSMWFKVLLFSVLLLRTKSFRRNLKAASRPQPGVMREILLPGTTLGIQQLIRSALFSFVLLSIGEISVTGLAATSAALSLYQLLVIPIIGLATAVTVMTGQAYATRQSRLVQLVSRNGLSLSLIISVCIAAAMLLFPKLLLSVSLGGLTISELNEIQPLAIHLLGFAAVYCVLDTLALIVSAILKGIGKTGAILLATLVSGGVAIGIGQWWAASAAFWWGLLVAWSAVQLLILAASLVIHLREHHEAEQTVEPRKLAA